MSKFINKYGSIQLSSEQLLSPFCRKVTESPSESLYMLKYKKFPSKLSLGSSIGDTIDLDKFMNKLSSLLKDCNVEISENTAKFGNNDDTHYYFIMTDKNFMVTASFFINGFEILYDSSSKDLMEKCTDIVLKCIIRKKNTDHFFTIQSIYSGYALKPQNIVYKNEFDIDTLYNDDFVAENEKIERFIKQDDKAGIVMLHGVKGTGKTSYLRSLINANKDKKFIMVPPSLIPALDAPQFAEFISTLKDSIIILEDCESAIMSRNVNTANSSAVSLLLNFSDGLMADSLGLKFFCTFNTDLQNIDEALLRKGRLISKYEFKPLAKDKANALLKKLITANPPTVDTDMALADIFNYEETSYETKKNKRIGFNS